ncbi:uncharacterized protein BX664DRAFT_333099 [Halteromyces radiatus]|uniref:uncharacterized protein n=1 Tax=Halteromyces radiatus TaxID=101107 RepID=UPI00221E5B7A|nr:uncharacterized protein BX664DRAFT_333099 [Halteromyces radiatus]KAI8089476.1 hypothetical protein BX664DRAFT_333099 [Halteromyces radiatus]
MIRPSYFLFLLLLFVLPLFRNSLANAQSIQYAQRFPKSRLYSLSPASLGLGNMDGTIAAFGDFNADKFTDIFTLGQDQKSITIYTWDHKNFSFSPLLHAPHIQHDSIINNIIPGDYNYDGHLDVLVMDEPNAQGEFKMKIYFGNGNDSFVTPALDIPSAKTTLPMVLDLNGDMKLDLLGYSWETGELSAWINTAQSNSTNQTTSIFDLTSASSYFDPTFTSRCRWASPHSNAFVDLDGDCLADVVMVCDTNGRQSMQIWSNQRENGFKLRQTLDLPSNIGPLAFADMDGDGSTDIVFTVCSDNAHCAIHTVYNQQMGLCSKLDDPNSVGQCRSPRQLCVADPDFQFDITTPNSENYTIFSLAPYLDQGETVLTLDRNFPGTMPVPLHPGDYNLDGYPDLLVTTTKKVILLQSVWCTAQQCTDAAIKSNKRTFSLVRNGAESLSKITSPRHATFFDIDEDGSLDILVLQDRTSRPSTQRTPRFLINNFFNDAFFMKGLVSNGAHPEGSSTKPYGVNYPGANFKFTVLDTSGTKRVHQVPQLPQTGYMSLHTPYCLFGLGRTNNYVEEMFAGVTRHQNQNYLFYEGVIPNSQLVFLPYQPENVADSSSWKVELYVQPADYIPWVLVSLVAAALLLGIVVGSLYWMEKREDEKERRKALHIINFDAL